MIEANDISEKIQSDFGDKAGEVFKAFEEAFAKSDHLNNPRIIRCILFLTGGELGKLKGIITMAADDPRNVMLHAEYINPGQREYPERVRDFDNPFGQADLKSFNS